MLKRLQTYSRFPSGETAAPCAVWPAGSESTILPAAVSEICLRRAVELDPASFGLRYRLALTQQMLGETQEALENYEAVLRLRPAERGALNNIAWIYATHPDPQFRNGAKAVDLLRPLAVAEDCDADLLDTLAAAYAEAGRFDDALQTEEMALHRAGGNEKTPESIGDMQRRAGLYKKRQPYLDQPLLGLPSPFEPPAASPEKHK